MTDETKTVYRIVDRATGALVGVYSRGYHDEYEFASPESARGANCHGIHKDRERYAVQRVEVTYRVVDEDV